MGNLCTNVGFKGDEVKQNSELEEWLANEQVENMLEWKVLILGIDLFPFLFFSFSSSLLFICFLLSLIVANIYILFVGAGESGKSTVIKQLKSIYRIKPEESELNTAAAAIHYNTLAMMKILIANQR